MNRSIRRRLLVVLLPAIAIGWLVSAVLSYCDTLHEQGEVFDAQLAQAAKVLLLLTVHEEQESALKPSKKGLEGMEDSRVTQVSHPYEHRLIFQVWSLPDRTLVLHSENAPSMALSSLPSGYSNARIGDKRWRVFAVTDKEHGVQVEVAENYGRREALAQTIAIRALIPLFVMLPILALVLWFSVGRALLPVRRLASEVKHRRPTNLGPVRADDAPLEIMPLVESLNTLLDRVQRTFENERRFTADAAHELRTPLAGIKTQAQVAMRDTDAARRRQALEMLTKGVDRTTRVIEQLLTLARLDPETGLVDPRPVRLGRIVSEVAADLAPMALAKQIDIGVTDHGGGEIVAHADAVAILVRNLVDNALRYTPHGGTVELEIADRRGYAVLSVSDSGPGIPEDERPRVLERFYRSAQATDTGSGLGLSIVRRIAQLHRATIELHAARLGGLQVDVSFPLPLAPAPASLRRRRKQRGPLASDREARA